MKDKTADIFRLLWSNNDDIARLLRAHRPDLLNRARKKPTSRDCEDYITLCKEIAEADIPGLDEIL